MRNRSAQSVFLVIAALLYTAPSAVAQTNGGSSYSIFNIGDITTSHTASGAGHGEIESVSPSVTTINSLNPALWSTLQFVTIQTGILFSQYQLSDVSSTLYQNQTELRNFSIGVPYSVKNGGTIGLSVHPYSTVNYRSQITQQVPSVGDTTSTADITYSGNGGVSEFFLGASYRPLDWLAVGIGGSYYFGAVEYHTSIFFPNASLYTATYTTTNKYRGTGISVSAVAEPAENFKIAGVYESGSLLDVDQQNLTAFDELGRDVVDITDSSNFSLKIPPRITIGASYKTGRFLLATEASLQTWGDHAHFSTTRDATRLSFGVDRLPSESVNASGFESWTFRFGGFYDQTYYSLEQGDINALGVTLGAGIPVTPFGGLNSSTGLDIGMELGVRGTTDNGLTQELFGKFYFEMAISELWFIEPRK